MITWLRQNKFRSHTIAFTLMILAAIGMYLTSTAGNSGVIWILLGVFILGNLVAMGVK
jgi:hypothetical protein